MNKQDLDALLDEQVAELSKEIEPSRDLWSGIEKAIVESKQVEAKVIRADKRATFAVAASICTAVFTGWMTLYPATSQNDTVVDFATVMSKEFEQQKGLMLASAGKSDSSAFSDDIQTQLKELSDAQRAIVKALAQDPTNSDLIELLRWTQKQELDLLNQVISPQWQTI